MFGVEFLRFKIVVTIMLLTSIIINTMVMPLLIPETGISTPAENDTASDMFDYSDYKYVYINYASWMIILVLLYGLGALGYSLITKSTADLTTLFKTFNTFIIGSEQMPCPRPMIQLAVSFILVSFATTMYMVEARRSDEGFLEGAMRIKAAPNEEDYDTDAAAIAAAAKTVEDEEHIRRTAYRKDMVEAINWIHSVCTICFAVAFIRALKFE